MKYTEKRLEFWKMLEANQFVKSTNSITDQVEEYQPAIQDMEATVRINGEFDKYAIDEWLTTSIQQALAEERERVTGILSAENYKLEEWYASSERPDTLTHFEANQRNIKTRNEIQVIIDPLDSK